MACCPACRCALPHDLHLTVFKECCGILHCLRCFRRDWTGATACVFCHARPATTDEEVVTRLERHVEKHDIVAMCLLVGFLVRGAGVARNHVRAAALLEESAERGLAAAQYNLACGFKSGQLAYRDEDDPLDSSRTHDRVAVLPFPVDPAAAERWLRRAADAGHREASYDLALLSASDPHQLPLVITLLQQAASAGSRSAMASLATLRQRYPDLVTDADLHTTRRAHLHTSADEAAHTAATAKTNTPPTSRRRQRRS